MFTGLVAAVGTVAASRTAPFGGRRLVVECPAGFADEVRIGDSVAVHGACLTAVSAEAPRLGFDLVAETLARTTLGAAGAGARVNLELPLRASDRLGGHFVQGHVDAVADVVAADREVADVRLRVRHRKPRWIVEKGSVALDGVSLTVASSLPGESGPEFEVALIPHTLAATTLGALAAGDRVNVEYDVLAKLAAP